MKTVNGEIQYYAVGVDYSDDWAAQKREKIEY